jgi:seryl-tRNA synthetase
MTFEEIQKIIEGMLAVQRELQEGQLKLQVQFQESQAKFEENQAKFEENQARIQEAQVRDTERFNQHIAQMMSVQRELQESQIDLRDRQERERETIQILVEEIFKLVEVSNRHENRINQLIG